MKEPNQPLESTAPSGRDSSLPLGDTNLMPFPNVHVLPRLLSVALAAILLPGCVMGPCGIGFSKPQVSLRDRQKEQDVAARFYSATHADVPLPDTTPYDANAEERAAYLESYREGYRCGLLVGIPGQDFGNYYYPQQSAAHFAVRVEGWKAGKKDASLAPSKLLNDTSNQSPESPRGARGSP